MRVLIDAVHPADVWTLGAVEDRLLANGEETLWISRPEKDSVVELIEARGRPHVRGPRAGTSMLSLGRELLARVNRRGRVFLTGTVAGGRFLCRICVLHLRTTPATLDDAGEATAGKVGGFLHPGSSSSTGPPHASTRSGRSTACCSAGNQGCV